MPDKQTILDNVDQYSAEELVEFIKQGVVTFEELCDDTDGHFPAHVRREVNRMLENAEKNEEEDWTRAKDSRSVELLESYLKEYPDGSHRDEARALLRALSTQSNDEKPSEPENGAMEADDKSDIKDAHLGLDIKSLETLIKNIPQDPNVTDPNKAIYDTIDSYLKNEKISHSDLLGMIRHDNNILGSAVINELIKNNLLAKTDFSEIGIDRVFVDCLAEGKKAKFPPPTYTITGISRQSTEVYFWGIPSSGKSCALGAILSVANNGIIANTMRKDPKCQGYGYMIRLASLFKSDSVCLFPESTSIYSTYEMGFNLIDDKKHPITCIDLAGELVRCMYKQDAGENMSEDEKASLNTLTNILIDNRTSNRKIHFFVLEYGAEDRLYEGLDQREYLDAALEYIKNTHIFEKSTDAIYLMITKVDKANAKQENLKDILSEYVRNAYLSFYNGLKDICKENDINDGEVEIIPFTLGKVCFQDYCLFDSEPASNVVRKLLTRCKGFKTGQIGQIIRMIKK